MNKDKSMIRSLKARQQHLSNLLIAKNGEIRHYKRLLYKLKEKIEAELNNTNCEFIGE